MHSFQNKTHLILGKPLDEVALLSVVHISAFTLSLCLPGFGPGIYLGLVCLFPRRAFFSLQWLYPMLVGIAQIFLALCVNQPLDAAVFVGGLQAWMQRAAGRQLGSRMAEWLVILLFFVVMVKFAVDIDRNHLPVWETVLFLALFWLGRAGARCFWGTPENQKLHTKELWQNQAAHQKIARRAIRTGPQDQKTTRQHPVPFEGFQELQRSVEHLYRKQQRAPESIRGSIHAICVATGNIMQCMAEDPRDVEHGRAFLKRYLPAAHTIVDKHAKLSQERTHIPDVEGTLAKSEDILKRLHAAFAKEHAFLLQNDVMDLSVELNVLDTMLKMQGR